MWSPDPKFPNGSQSDPLEGPAWGAGFLQGSAGKVFGLRGFETGLRGFGRRAGEGVQRRGVGGRKPPPIEGSKHSDHGSTDSLIFSFLGCMLELIC